MAEASTMLSVLLIAIVHWSHVPLVLLILGLGQTMTSCPLGTIIDTQEGFQLECPSMHFCKK